MNPITECHQVKAVVVGGDEGTNHYECPVCHQSVNIDGSLPTPVEAKKELATLLDNYMLEVDEVTHIPPVRDKYVAAIQALVDKAVLDQTKLLRALITPNTPEISRLLDSEVNRLSQLGAKDE